MSDTVTRCLTELDIPGASLNGRPQDLTIPQLKRWLQCRNASLKGEKAILVARLVPFTVSMVRFGDIATVQHSVIILLIDQSKYSFVYFFLQS